MANPSPAATAAIRAAVADWSPDDDAIAAALNAPAVANPAPQPTVPKPYGFSDVMGCLSSASVGNVRGLGSAVDLIVKINDRDSSGVLHWVAALLAGTPLITPAEAAAVQAVVTATEPDPSYPAQISWAQANLGRPVDLADIAASRPGA